MSILNENDIRQFWIRVYLGSNNDIIDACIDRAYRDFNRTMRGLGKEQSNDKYKEIKSYLRKHLEILFSQNFDSQSEFDEWHKGQCRALKKRFNEIYTYQMTIGQAQKWINMSLKYFYAIGDDKIPGISTNYHLFHIPIDTIIQEKLIKEKGIQTIDSQCGNTWSGMDSYDVYIKYQEDVRRKLLDEIPMDVEFRLFNEN